MRWLVAGAALGAACGATEVASTPPPPTPDAGVARVDCRTRTSTRPRVEAVVDRQVLGTVLDLVDSAERCVDVVQFELIASGSVRDARSALIRAHDRGVQVRLLLDDEVTANASTVNTLRRRGLNVRQGEGTIRTHVKLVVADGGMLLGSTNFSGSSFDSNHETNLLIRDPAVVEVFRSYAAALWEDQDHRPTPVPAGDWTDMQPWLDGGYSSVVLPRVEAATTRIDALVYAVNLSPRFPDGPVAKVAASLQAAAARGVAVRVIFEISDYNEPLNELNRAAAEMFRAQGVEVRFDPVSTISHAKLLMIDDAAAVGTNNWGYRGLVVDHEAGVLTTNSEVVADLSSYFEQRWAEAR